jgi:hypothetical protein
MVHKTLDEETPHPGAARPASPRGRAALKLFIGYNLQPSRLRPVDLVHSDS